MPGYRDIVFNKLAAFTIHVIAYRHLAMQQAAFMQLRIARLDSHLDPLAACNGALA
jgi:hypothetical protein